MVSTSSLERQKIMHFHGNDTYFKRLKKYTFAIPITGPEDKKILYICSIDIWFFRIKINIPL